MGALWLVDQPRVVFLGVNPSTADASVDDHTVRRWIGFTLRWGVYAGFDVGNLFALRSTDVAALAEAPDPVGPDCDEHLRSMLHGATAVVPCWGCRKKLPEHLRERIDQVRSLIAASGLPVYVLGLTKGGDPLHPLRLPYSTPLMEWRP